MQKAYFLAEDRGQKDIDWLQSNFTFSFSDFRNPVMAGFGLLRVFNDDFVQPGKGFGLHPHVNMEIVSVMLKGRMNHKDTMGYSEEVDEDWVQIMSAGSGLRHEEYNIGDEEVNFLQIWIEPKQQNINPRYQRRHFPKSKRENQLVTIVDNDEGTRHCWINQNARLSLGYFTRPETITYQLKPFNKAVFVFNIAGTLQAGGETFGERDALGIWDTAEIELKTGSGSEFLLIEVPINH